MAVTFTKKQMQHIADVMDGDHDSLEAATEAVVNAVVEAYQQRGAWMVVGHLRWKPWRYDTPGALPTKGTDGHWMDEQDWRDSRVCIGPFTTEKQAQEARSKLAVSTQTGEEFSTWVFPVFDGSPFEFFKTRKPKRGKDQDETSWDAQKRALERRTEWFKHNQGAVELPHDIDDERDRCERCGQLLEGESHGE